MANETNNTQNEKTLTLRQFETIGYAKDLEFIEEYVLDELDAGTDFDADINWYMGDWMQDYSGWRVENGYGEEPTK